MKHLIRSIKLCCVVSVMDLLGVNTNYMPVSRVTLSDKDPSSYRSDLQSYELGSWQ